jgi:hypothetical protein
MELLGIERGLTEGGDTPTAQSVRSNSSTNSSSFSGLGWGPGASRDAPGRKLQSSTLSSLTKGPIAPTGLDADSFFECMLKSGNMFSPTAMLVSLKTPTEEKVDPDVDPDVLSPSSAAGRRLRSPRGSSGRKKGGTPTATQKEKEKGKEER